VSVRHKSLAEQIDLSEQIEPDNRETIINVIDSMLTKKKMLDLLIESRTAYRMSPCWL